MSNINSQVLQLITESIPQQTTPVNILREVLDLHRESAYRRLRGEVNFTIEELVKLHSVLNLPIHKLFSGIKSDTKHISAILINNNPSDLKNYCKSAFDIIEQTSSALDHVYMALNQVPYNFIFKNELLSRIHYYKWISDNNSDSSVQYYLSQSIPKIVRERQQLIKDHIESNDVTYIFSDDMFQSTCKEIQYYKQLGYISDEELKQLKKELLSIVDEMTALCKEEHFKSGRNVKIYISNININSSFYCIQYKAEDQQSDSSVHYLYGGNHIISHNSIFAKSTKKHFYRLIKDSTLISKSGAKYRFPYFMRQKDLINSIS